MSRTTPPPASRLVDAPALQMGRQIDGVEHPREQRLADAPLLDRLAHRAMRRGVAQMVVRAHDDAAFAAVRDHRARVGEGQRQRLLAQHVLARARRGEHLIAMQLVGGRDVDGVDAGVGDEGSEVGAGAPNRVLGGERVCARRRRR